MSDLRVPTPVIFHTKGKDLELIRDKGLSWHADDVRLRAEQVTDEVLTDLAQAATAAEDGKFSRVVEAIAAARRGEVKMIPSFNAAPEILAAYLREGLIDGWLYQRGSDGHLHPRLVTRIQVVEARGQGDERYISIGLTSDYPFSTDRSRSRDGGVNHSITLHKSDVARKRPDAVMLQAGYYRETPELKAAYLERLARFQELMNGGFAEQFRYTGTPQTDNYRTANPVTNRKVVHDVKPSELLALRGESSSELAPEDVLLPVPVDTQVRVFDLHAHEFYTVNANDLTAYEYDETLRDKLILPDDQRELLDVLTSDLEAFTADIIEGKSAGNVVLAKGLPGVGKTLTAEVYAEIVKRPLYAIHSGVLGTRAEDVRKNLEAAFTQAQRWNAVLLLDEADVFVLARGNDIAQNAICAEFLRTLEYFDGLLFMTTNRSDDIDDAIISRCAALIDYQVPGPVDARKIWGVLATQMKATIPADVLDDLLTGLPQASPRDMKMLLRLTLRMAKSRNSELTTDLFARCAMFRGLHLHRVTESL